MTGNLLSAVAIVVAMAFVIVNDTFVKLTSTELAIGQIIVTRGAMASVLLLVAAWWMGQLRPLSCLLSPVVGWRMIGETLATVCFLIGFVHMPFADSNAILQVVPLATTAASAAFLGERVGWRRWLAAVVGFLGTLLIIRPGFNEFNPYSMLIVLSVVLVVVRDLATRMVVTSIPTMMLALMSAVSVAVIGMALAPFEVWHWPSAKSLMELAISAICLSLGYVLTTIAIRTGEMSVVAPFRYSVVIFAVISGWLVWNEVPSRYVIAGILIVIAAGLYTFYREQRVMRAT